MGFVSNRPADFGYSGILGQTPYLYPERVCSPIDDSVKFPEGATLKWMKMVSDSCAFGEAWSVVRRRA